MKIYNVFTLMILAAFLGGCATVLPPNHTGTEIKDDDFQTTAKLYEEMISGENPNVAGLNLFFTKLKNNAVIEINLTSNAFILGVENNAHPYLIYSKYGVPLIISTDDSGVSRNNLSNEYMLLASRYKPSYTQIKEYVYNSITYSFLDPKDKLAHKKILDEKFLIFQSEIAELSKIFNNQSGI